jgi:hypothetical protein
MGFEPYQPPFRVEAVNEFMDRMKDMLEEAKAVLAKAKNEMALYYNRRRAPAPTFVPGDKVYLNATDIQSHRRLSLYPVERCIGKYAYCLTLPHSMRHLHPVFNMVKLTLAAEDPISGRQWTLPPPPELVNEKEEYNVESVLNSRMFRQRLQYLVRWKGYGVEHNSWEYAENVENTPEKVAEFHSKNPAKGNSLTLPRARDRSKDSRALPTHCAPPRPHATDRHPVGDHHDPIQSSAHSYACSPPLRALSPPRPDDRHLSQPYSGLSPFRPPYPLLPLSVFTLDTPF